MKLHYDEKADALYLHLDESKVEDSREVQPGIVLDFNAQEQVVAIEVRSVKERFRSADAPAPSV